MRLTFALSKCFQPISALWYLFRSTKNFYKSFLVLLMCRINRTLFYFLRNEILHHGRRSCCRIVIGVFFFGIVTFQVYDVDNITSPHPWEQSVPVWCLPNLLHDFDWFIVFLHQLLILIVLESKLIGSHF